MLKKAKPGHWRYLALAPLLLLLNGCAKHSAWWIFNPQGVGAKASYDYMMIDVVVMLSIVGITALLIVWFMWKYHKGKNRGSYDGKVGAFQQAGSGFLGYSYSGRSVSVLGGSRTWQFCR